MALDIDAVKFIADHIWAPLIGILGYQQYRRDKKMDKIEAAIDEKAFQTAKELKLLERRQDDHELLIAREYATRAEIKENFQEIKLTLKEISAKLDKKADK